MNCLTKILPIENIILDVFVTCKKHVFEKAGLILEKSSGISSEIIIENLLAREYLGSTGLGGGVAIPHGCVKGLKESLAAFIRLKTPIPFESPDNQDVSLLIFLLVQEQAGQQDLEILSEISQLLSNYSSRKCLEIENDIITLHKHLTQWNES